MVYRQSCGYRLMRDCAAPRLVAHKGLLLFRALSHPVVEESRLRRFPATFYRTILQRLMLSLLLTIAFQIFPIMMSGFADAVGYELQCLLIHSLSDSSMCKDNKFFFLTGNHDKKCEGTDTALSFKISLYRGKCCYFIADIRAFLVLRF